MTSPIFQIPSVQPTNACYSSISFHSISHLTFTEHRVTNYINLYYLYKPRSASVPIFTQIYNGILIWTFKLKSILCYLYLAEFCVERRLFEAAVYRQRNDQQLISVTHMEKRRHQIATDLPTTTTIVNKWHFELQHQHSCIHINRLNVINSRVNVECK